MRTTVHEPHEPLVRPRVLNICLVDRSLFLTLAQGAFASIYVISALATLMTEYHAFTFRNALVAELISNAGETVFVRLADGVR